MLCQRRTLIILLPLGELAVINAVLFAAFDIYIWALSVSDGIFAVTDAGDSAFCCLLVAKTVDDETLSGSPPVFFSVGISADSVSETASTLTVEVSLPVVDLSSLFGLCEHPNKHNARINTIAVFTVFIFSPLIFNNCLCD